MIFLYVSQGVAIGFVKVPLPILFKKHFNYIEIGIISYWTLPYIIKFLFAPFVDSLFIKMLGKRKSWIVPSQIISAVLLYLLSFNLESFIENKQIYFITLSLFIIILCWAIQDIAVDGWWVTIVKPENLAYTGSAQLIGLEIGSFISTTVFIALSSVEFCNKYIYRNTQTEPILNEINYMQGWAIIFLCMAIYILLFSTESNDRVKIEDHETPSIQSWYEVVLSLIKNKQMQKVFLIILSFRLFSSVNEYVGKIHLIDDLGYSQSNFSIILMITFPLSIIVTTFMTVLSNSKMLYVLAILTILKLINDIFTINIVYYWISDSIYFDIILWFSLSIGTWINWCFFSVGASYGNNIVDPRIASTQLTFINSMFSFWYNFPRLYTFILVNWLGVYIPNFVMSILGIITCLCLLNTADDEKLHQKIEVDESHFKNE